jgi:hypothetical protein
MYCQSKVYRSQKKHRNIELNEFVESGRLVNDYIDEVSGLLPLDTHEHVLIIQGTMGLLM